ncbi:hypothetical protein L6164_019937 [Bauhinia variegata]|uniref:Uncharacterized protein n=1 Tax=Bauhinia variegata TaxID=167791 RepID=A0ACB9MUS0_BAUVA|nr:hypothetical protein L6164_019937 [Bauhinia variegata]
MVILRVLPRPRRGLAIMVAYRTQLLPPARLFSDTPKPTRGTTTASSLTGSIAGFLLWVVSIDDGRGGRAFDGGRRFGSGEGNSG